MLDSIYKQWEIETIKENAIALNSDIYCQACHMSYDFRKHDESRSFRCAEASDNANFNLYVVMECKA